MAHIINGENIRLNTLFPNDVTQKYIDWLNDPEATRYTESRFAKHTMESVRQYVINMYSNMNEHFYGIYTDDHIGNIKLTVNPYHMTGDIGLLIGDKPQWGKGYATEAIKLLTEYGFKIGLHKISAGIYSNNIGSIKVFEKAGYEKEAVLCENRLFEGRYIDEIIMCKKNI